MVENKERRKFGIKKTKLIKKWDVIAIKLVRRFEKSWEILKHFETNQCSKSTISNHTKRNQFFNL
jgi:hypothetical protein